jgi:molecular chaperone DnaJ
MEAMKGTERTIVHQGKEHTIRIPAGASDGTRIRFDEFDVSVNVGVSDIYKRDGYDLFVDQEIPFTLAAMGGEVGVPTIDGEVKLKVRPGTQPNTMIRLRERGAPHLRGRGRGDEYVRLVVTIPKNLSREQRKILQRFEETR